MERRHLLHHVQPEKGEDNDSNLDPILWSGRLLLDQPGPEKFRMVRQASLAARDRASRARRCNEQVDKLKDISMYIPDLKFVATAATGGSVKFLSVV